MIDNPLVSIITPVLNGNKYLKQCLESVLSQTYPYIEHIFVDGGSSDGTLKRLAIYHAEYPKRIKFITGKDKGVGSALNKGYKISRGEIIGWIDSDDIYEPDAIETAVDFFRKDPDASFVYGDCNMINEKGEAIACFIIKDFDLDEWVNTWHYIVFCAAFYRRRVIEKAGYLNNLGNDLDFYLRVSKQFKIHRIKKKFTSWRLHGGSISLKRASREDKIRKERARQDFFLILKYGGSIFSPRAKVYYYSILVKTFNIYSLIKALRPYLGFTYPLLKKALRAIRNWGLRRQPELKKRYVLAQSK